MQDEVAGAGDARGSDEAIDPELIARVDRALARLPARRRNMLLLSHVEGWTCEQIAAAYGINADRVRRQVAAAMDKVIGETLEGRRLPFWRQWL